MSGRDDVWRAPGPGVDDPVAERLRRALDWEAARVVPSGAGLEEIRSRLHHREPVRWLPFALAAGAAAAAGILVGAVVAGGDDRLTSAPPAASPTATPPATPTPTPTPSVTPSPSPTATRAPAAPPASPAPTGGTPSPTPTGEPGTAAVPVYWLGDTERGPRLYREFRRVPVPAGEVRAALTMMITGAPRDPDYATPWDGVRLDGVTRDGARLTVDVSRVPGSGEAERAIALQQLVYTATAADNDITEVVVEGQVVRRAPQIDVVAPVWLLRPRDGETVGRRVALSGTASVFEANVSIQVRRGGAVVAETFATATQGAPGRGEWSATVTLEPGSYEIRAFESSPEDGRPTAVDSKRVTVE